MADTTPLEDAVGHLNAAVADAVLTEHLDGIEQKLLYLTSAVRSVTLCLEALINHEQDQVHREQLHEAESGGPQ